MTRRIIMKGTFLFVLAAAGIQFLVALRPLSKPLRVTRSQAPHSTLHLLHATAPGLNRAVVASIVVCAGWLLPIFELPVAAQGKTNNPDAIDIRRVAQQPEVPATTAAAAPDAPRIVTKLPSGVRP